MEIVDGVVVARLIIVRVIGVCSVEIFGAGLVAFGVDGSKNRPKSVSSQSQW